MKVVDIKEISLKKDKLSCLKDKKNILTISVSIASGLAWKDKLFSFYEVIAKELLEIFDNNMLEGITLNKINNNYVKIYINDEMIYYNRNNLFLNTYEKLKISDFLKQDLVVIESKKLPQYLTSKEKENLSRYLSKEEMHIINKNYNKQELNSDKFTLDLVSHDERELTNLLTKAKFYSQSIYEYLEVIARGNYDYRINTLDDEISSFKTVYNNYILELGAYVSKVIEEYLK